MTIEQESHGRTENVGRNLDGVPQPYVGAIVLLETIAEFGAQAFFEDGTPTPNRELCLKFAKELREAMPRIAELEKERDTERNIVGEMALTLGRIDEALGIDADESGGAGVTLDAIAEQAQRIAELEQTVKNKDYARQMQLDYAAELEQRIAELEKDAAPAEPKFCDYPECGCSAKAKCRKKYA